MDTIKNPFVSLVVPTFNEALNIIPFLEGAHAALTNYSHEVIVVDDNSPDRTWEKASQYSVDHKWVRVIRRQKNRGLSPSVLEGFRHARGNILAVMDADLSHDEKILPNLIEAVVGGAEMAIGSRRIKGGGADNWPWHRRLLSNGATLLAKSLLSMELSDPMSGYFAIPKKLYENVHARLRPRGYKILLELYLKARPSKITEVPFIFRDRTQGQSKLTLGVIFQYIEMLIRSRFGKRP